MSSGETLAAVTVRRVIWNGYVLSCPDCSAQDIWGLYLGRDDDGRETAWAMCRAGHMVAHPLIYPAAVRCVTESTATPAPSPRPGIALHLLDSPRGAVQHRVDQALAEIDWSPRYQSDAWPGLADAGQVPAAVAEFGRTAAAESLTGWLAVFGTGDPDRRSIEIAMAPPASGLRGWGTAATPWTDAAAE